MAKMSSLRNARDDGCMTRRPQRLEDPARFFPAASIADRVSHVDDAVEPVLATQTRLVSENLVTICAGTARGFITPTARF
jgi:hypothetical protein